MVPEVPKHNLEDFIAEKMSMSHIYQPAMLKVLLENGGEASVEEIAKSFLLHDISQVEYYSMRTNNMVGKVLRDHGIVRPVKKGRRISGYQLVESVNSENQRNSLIQLCEEKLSRYAEKRGKALWEHRSISEGLISGSVRYEVLKRAKYRCELCGAHESQTAMHVDHIIPRANGGSDDVTNLQCLCFKCNTNKRNNDDTDFRSVHQSYAERDKNCLFCNLKPSRIIDENELCIAIRDGYPVTTNHTLIIPRRHVPDYFDLYQPELNAIHSLLHSQKNLIMETDPAVTGFNVGINSGASAGQTIFHVHVHLIPRKVGDVENPRGGVRGVIPSKQNYAE